MRSKELKREEDAAHAAIKGYATLREHAAELRKVLTLCRKNGLLRHWNRADEILYETRYLCDGK
jgi:hypothetical protein